MANITLPLSPEVLQTLSGLNNIQLAWLSGYAWAKSQEVNGAAMESAVGFPPTFSAPNTILEVSVLSASQTGNAKSVADQLATRLQSEGIAVSRKSLADYKAKNIAQEKVVILVTSTQGEGEPPEEGVLLLKLLQGKKAPKLTGIKFAVLSLGDSSYPHFCQAGKDFDHAFANLGAERLLSRVDADLDFKSVAEEWVNNITNAIKENVINQQPQTQGGSIQEHKKAALTSISPFNKENPFSASLITNQRLTDSRSAKDVRHLELDLSGSGLDYQAGDALGVYFENDPDLVAEILAAVGVEGDAEVTLKEKTLSIFTALQSELELTQNNVAFVKSYAILAKNDLLNEIVQDVEKCHQFVAQTPIVDVLHQFPTKLTAEQLASLFRPLTPRLYSISSSAAEVGEEVHLTVGVVRYDYQGKARAGGASSYLADRVEEDGRVRVFIEKNDHFRLPQDPKSPIIMIGSGTGIAPFRAFVQQRAAENAEGRNWLIFGNPHFALDFLYQTEWQQFAKEGFLHKYSFAWSRDQAQKIYVQDKIQENGEEIWRWLQEGAYIYVCGDATKMAKDVNQALLEVIATQGKLTADEAEEYLDGLREEKRYQRDVY
ncbi:assimilatory sulfite reductase (NADPH) flavoprotein subunit [Avibacterium sp. 20-129]|uniref:assimilatory sulfite reductase (NADPH) flavoprotein subunit n=1 Tax=Avibacterium sp. 20-129 TaxID=2911525 RepID=UPI002247344C|nr:assimilatory sulfite reductase (NADPH) flavoprotein subunit [Avibacterium sp. 20-129]MCW9699572.1 assimilatory sulfite reductase (NADPH) flavoprotein subunit [Avibacterium sp. 20-129]